VTCAHLPGMVKSAAQALGAEDMLQLDSCPQTNTHCSGLTGLKTPNSAYMHVYACDTGQVWSDIGS
jgi:hypothetical protein